jgi:ClpP class serine protease
MDITYQEFKTTVQINRNLTEEELNSVVEGRVFAAVEAVDNKLIDGITTLSEILSWEGAH